MQIMKIVMSDETEYSVIWDTDRIRCDFYNMLDIKQGWVTINKNYIMHQKSLGEAKDVRIHPKVRDLVKEVYGDDLYLD